MSPDRPEQSQPRRGLVGRVLGGRYRVTRLVSAGASALIADAEDTELGRPVTVKLVRPEFAESTEFRNRFRSTMRSVTGLAHPNIAAVYDWGEELIGKRTTVYAVVEHLGGGSLRDLFDRGRYLDPSQALLVGLEACRGLDFGHRRGLVHTELTPSKLVFGDDRRLRIVDFGFAALLGEAPWTEPATLPTHVARYSSPEQALSQPLDGKADVYALTLVLVEAVTQRVPFAARSTVATLSARIGRLMPVSADLGPLASVLERAGRPEADDRSTAAEFGRALVRIAEKLPRPEPIPILVATGFEDPSRMRRPHDPTGGLARPADTDAPPAAGIPVDEGVGADAGVSGEPDGDAVAAGADPDAGADDAGADPAAAGAAEHDATGDHDADPGPDADAGADSDGAGDHEATAVSDSEAPGELDAPGAQRDADGQHVVVDGQHDDGQHDAAEVERSPGPPPADPAPPPPPRSPPPPSADDPRPSPPAWAPPPPDARPAPPVPPPPPASPTLPDDPATAPRLYDGDADVTRDELAGLARRVPGEAIIGSFDEPRGTTLQAVRPAETDTGWTEAPSSGRDVIVADSPPMATIATATARQTDAQSAHSGTQEERPHRRWLTALTALVLLAALGGLALLASLLFRGPPRHEIPELGGLQLDAATSQIAAFDWDLDVRTERSDDQPIAGRVVRTVPIAGSDLAEGEPFLLVVSDGPELRTLPELRGLAVGEAETELAELRLVALAPTERFDEEVPAGEVVSWSVPADAALVASNEVLPATEVAIVVSIGPEPREVPDVVGQSVDEATATLRELRLEVTVAEPVFDNEIPDGEVISMAPSAGDVLERGATVDLLSSKGQDLVAVPDLSGLTLPQAREALTAAGLQIGAMVGNSLGTFAQATVGGDEVGAGEEFLRNTAVDVVFL